MSRRALIFVWFCFQIPIGNLFCAYESDLEHLISIFKDRGQLESEDRQILQSVLSKWQKGTALSILEDNVIYNYIQFKNVETKPIFSPYNKSFKAYKRFDGIKYFFVIEDTNGDGIIHSIVELKEHEPVPNFSWSPTELKILFESIEDGSRNISVYEVGHQNFSPFINSIYDDFSPIFHPSGSYIVFLSNRDRESESDDRTALYFIDQNEPFRPVKFSDLDSWKPNTHADPNALKFRSVDRLIAQVDNRIKEFALESILASLKQAKEMEKKRLQEEAKKLAEEKNEVEEDSSQVIMSVVKDSQTARVLLENGVYMLQIQNNPGGLFRTITSIPGDYLQRPRGPLFILDPPYFFYRGMEQNLSRLFLYRDGKSEAISPPDENSYAMAWNRKESLLAYLIERNATTFLNVFSIEPREFVMLSRVESIFSKNSRDELIRIEGEDRIMVRNALGDFVLVTDESEIDSGTQNNLATRQINPMYEAPFQVPRKQWMITPQKAQSQPEALVWSELEIEREMSKLTEDIKWLSTQDELSFLKERFNVVHEQAAVWIKRWDLTGDATLRTKALRWTENINGIKVLINNAQILIEIE